MRDTFVWHTVYPKKYAHGFVVLCFVVVMQSFIMNSHEVFIHIHQGCFAGTGAIVRLPKCQWSKPDGYWKISQCITTTKHSKAKTVCIFLGIYCTQANLFTVPGKSHLSKHSFSHRGAKPKHWLCFIIHQLLRVRISRNGEANHLSNGSEWRRLLSYPTAGSRIFQLNGIFVIKDGTIYHTNAVSLSKIQS